MENTKDKLEILENHNPNDVLRFTADGRVYHRGVLVSEEIVMQVLAPFVNKIKEQEDGK